MQHQQELELQMKVDHSPAQKQVHLLVLRLQARGVWSLPPTSQLEEQVLAQLKQIQELEASVSLLELNVRIPLWPTHFHRHQHAELEHYLPPGVQKAWGHSS